jgi:hypothetical protein
LVQLLSGRENLFVALLAFRSEDPLRGCFAGGVASFAARGKHLTVGNLTLDGVVNVGEVVSNSFLSATVGNTWRLFDYAGSLTDNGLTLGTTSTLRSGLSFELDTAAPGQVDSRVVPQPSAAVCLNQLWLTGNCRGSSQKVLMAAGCGGAFS